MEKITDDEIMQLMKKYNTKGCLSCMKRILDQQNIDMTFYCLKCNSRYHRMIIGEITIGKKVNSLWVRIN